MGEEGGGVEEETAPSNQFSFPHFLDTGITISFFARQNFRLGVSSVAENISFEFFKKKRSSFSLDLV
jgi:hypothetical protein